MDCLMPEYHGDIKGSSQEHHILLLAGAHVSHPSQISYLIRYQLPLVVSGWYLLRWVLGHWQEGPFEA